MIEASEIAVATTPKGIEIHCKPGFKDQDLADAMAQHDVPSWDYGITETGVEVFTSYMLMGSPSDLR